MQAHYIREGTFVFLEGLVDEHVALELVLAIERGVTHRALEGLLTWGGERPGLRDSAATQAVLWPWTGHQASCATL